MATVLANATKATAVPTVKQQLFAQQDSTTKFVNMVEHQQVKAHYQTADAHVSQASVVQIVKYFPLALVVLMAIHANMVNQLE